MNQPECGTVVPPPDPEPLPSRDIAGWIGWVVVLVAVAIFDVWLFKHRRDTMSEKLRRTSQKWLWFRLFLIGTMVMATIHFVWGFWW